jgi:hypothetical protein
VQWKIVGVAGSSSFLKKRTKKLLCPGVRRRREPRQRHKSLLLLFFRKEDLPFPEFTDQSREALTTERYALDS